MFVGTSGLELVGLEDSTAPYVSAKRMNLVEVGQAGQLQHLTSTIKKGTRPTLPTFLVMFVGTSGLELVGLEDSTAPYGTSDFQFCLSIVAQLPSSEIGG